MFRATTAISRDLTKIVNHVNRLLHEDLTDSRSVTAVLGMLEGDTLAFLSAGQGPLLRYLAASGEVQCHNAHGIPLGIIPDYPWPAAERSPSGTVLVWSPPLVPGATSLSYEILRTRSADDFQSGTTCLSSIGPSLVDGENPSPDQVFHYLPRAANTCPDGTGPLGAGTDGIPRTGRDCS